METLCMAKTALTNASKPFPRNTSSFPSPRTRICFKSKSKFSAQAQNNGAKAGTDEVKSKTGLEGLKDEVIRANEEGVERLKEEATRASGEAQNLEEKAKETMQEGLDDAKEKSDKIKEVVFGKSEKTKE